ncbi:MAG: hypothetical protein AB7U05_17215 [Mangrovibacterium sp.]
MKVSQLSKAEKIDLIKRIQSGDVPLIINGEIIENTAVLIQREGKLYAEGIEVSWEQLNSTSSERSVIILPDNGRDKM